RAADCGNAVSHRRIWHPVECAGGPTRAGRHGSQADIPVCRMAAASEPVVPRHGSRSRIPGMKIRVQMMLKASVLDPQGKAIGDGLATLGFNGIGEVRQGKLIALELAETDPARASEQVEAMCKELLANPVIEDYSIEVLPSN